MATNIDAYVYILFTACRACIQVFWDYYLYCSRSLKEKSVSVATSLEFVSKINIYIRKGIS